jgi:Na+/proline symporter
VLVFVLRKQQNKDDYFWAGRALGWKPLSLSIMARQLSAVSVISAPAFVGLREGGGLIWLSFYAGDIAPPIIEAINKVGLIFYGPMLTMFILAIASKKRCSRHVNNRVL